MSRVPPTVTCPGCERDIEVDHDRGVTLDGRVVAYIRRQSDSDALLEHWDSCPRQQTSR